MMAGRDVEVAFVGDAVTATSEVDFLARLHRAATAKLDSIDRACLRESDPDKLAGLFAMRLVILRERAVEAEQSGRGALARSASRA